MVASLLIDTKARGGEEHAKQSGNCQRSACGVRLAMIVDGAEASIGARGASSPRVLSSNSAPRLQRAEGGYQFERFKFAARPYRELVMCDASNL